MQVNPNESIYFELRPDINDLYIAEFSNFTDQLNFLLHGKIENGIIGGFCFKRNYEEPEFSLNGPIEPDERNFQIQNLNDYFANYSEYVNIFDVFYLYPLNLLDGSIYIDPTVEGNIIHLSICPESDYYETYQFITTKSFLVYSNKFIIKLFIPQITTETLYWGIYLITKESPWGFKTSKYTPFLCIRTIDQNLYNDVLPNELNPDYGSYWHLHPNIIRLGIIIQNFNMLIGRYEYSLILNERDDFYSEFVYLIKDKIIDLNTAVKEKFPQIIIKPEPSLP